jgi:hypothetical protein
VSFVSSRTNQLERIRLPPVIQLDFAHLLIAEELRAAGVLILAGKYSRSFRSRVASPNQAIGPLCWTTHYAKDKEIFHEAGRDGFMHNNDRLNGNRPGEI